MQQWTKEDMEYIGALYQAMIEKDMQEFDLFMSKQKWVTATGNPLTVIEGGKHDDREC